MNVIDSNNSSKLRSAIEILACYFILLFLNISQNWVGQELKIDGLWAGVVFYFLVASILLFYVIKIEKKPLSSIGLRPIVFKEIVFGIIIGIIMFTVQQIPMVLMGMDYRMFASPPDWVHIGIMSLYCIFCVGFTEEVVMRGFILHKSMGITKNKIIVILLNSIIFYMIHWPPVRFVFGEAFNITLNTIILCTYFFVSKRKSITPLIIAHGVYDILAVYLLPAFVYFMTT